MPIRVLFAAGLAAVLGLLDPRGAFAQASVPSGAGLASTPLEAVASGHPDGEPEQMQLRWQATWVTQHKPSFSAAYSGPNSLSTMAERSYSFTTTAMAGMRLWNNAEVYLNPEVASGVPLSSLTGFGGFPNGELARTSGPQPHLYVARAFLRQTWGFGGGTQWVDSDQNQLAGSVDNRRLVLTAGIFPLLDVFDDNAYSHDARTQFMNWALLTHGSYDYAADARGYSRGAALEWFDQGWAARVGRFAMPASSNGLPLNYNFGRSYGDQAELEHQYRLIDSQPGKVRFLVWRNRAVMGSFSDALAWGAANGVAPDVSQIRRDQAKYGWGINLEQPLGRLGGAFVRINKSDDQRETYSYTEIGGSISGGMVFLGANWGRALDTVGVAFARNTLSAAHQAYLAAGGLGFFLGDGHLDYRPESIFESYYSVGIGGHAWVSVDWQYVTSPGYNAVRGPVNIFGLRLHMEL
jgi:high affinity Mn2+ porin